VSERVCVRWGKGEGGRKGGKEGGRGFVVCLLLIDFCMSAFLVESNGVSGVPARFTAQDNKTRKGPKSKRKKVCMGADCCFFLPSLPPSL